MDKRQQKTRASIFNAFTVLMKKRSMNSITVQDIIDEANIGRSTFYAHFETKDALLEALCRELFDHILSTARDNQNTHGLYTCTDAPNSMVCHILRHLQENDHHILTLLSCESNDFFLRYFKSGMSELIRLQFLNRPDRKNTAVPDEFLINHIAGSFVEMVQWWLAGKRRESPEELDLWFQSVIEPIL